MNSRELFDYLDWSTTKEYTAQLLDNGGLSVNIEDTYTKLIKDAARTNRFSGDIRFTLNEIEYQLDNFKNNDEWKPVFVGFRRHGVDGTSSVLYEVNKGIPLSERRTIIDKYFAFYGIDLVKEKEYDSFYKLKVCERWT